MTFIPIYRPYVFLRCRECGRKTDHVMIDNELNGKCEIEEIYECQQCGEIKRIYELATSLRSSMESEISEKEERKMGKGAILKNSLRKRLERDADFSREEQESGS